MSPPLAVLLRTGRVALPGTALAVALAAPLLAIRAQAAVSTRQRLALLDGEARFMGGVSFDVGQPSGAFNRYVDEGYGIGAHGLYRVGRTGALAVRIDGGVLNYGHEKTRVALSLREGSIHDALNA